MKIQNIKILTEEFDEIDNIVGIMHKNGYHLLSRYWNGYVQYVLEFGKFNDLCVDNFNNVLTGK